MADTQTLRDFLSGILAKHPDVIISVTMADMNGCTWNVESEFGYTSMEMPFGSDDWDVAEHIKSVTDDLYLYVHITHPEDGHIVADISRDL